MAGTSLAWLNRRCLMWGELAEGVYRRRYQSLDLNIGLVVGDAGVLVIDTRGSAVQAQELLDDIAAVTALPVPWVVDTHWHWDHTFGNATSAAAPIWAHVECARVLAANGERGKEWLADAVPPDQRHEILAVSIRLPDRLFAVEEVIDLGGRSVTLRHHGLGHTEGDITVSVDGTEVRFVGDLLEEGARPGFDDSYPVSWPATAASLCHDTIATYVPGHGDVMTPEEAAGQVDELAAIAPTPPPPTPRASPWTPSTRRGSQYPEEVTATAMERAYAELASRSTA